MDDEHWAEPTIPANYSFGTPQRWREPFVSTPAEVVHRMLALAAVQPGERWPALPARDSSTSAG